MNAKAKRKARHGYGPGHPWYYVLGGKPLYPRQIIEEVEKRSYGGYLADEIERIDALVEPKRTRALRAMKTKTLAAYRADLSRYREVVLALHRFRAKESPTDAARCDDVHLAVSLKHNHLLGDLAHLRTLSFLLDRQRDLFDF